MKIKILKLGESATESDVPAGSTVADAIKAAGFESTGYTRTLNGHPVFDSARINEGDIITLNPKVEGGVR